MDTSDLTWSATRALFAAEWAAPSEGGASLRFPGAKVAGFDTASNLLNIALSNLRSHGILSFEQIRPIEQSRLSVGGGKSFARFAFNDPHTEMPGLEGALLQAARRKPGRLDNALSADDDHGVRRLVVAIGLDSGSPWRTVGRFCQKELEEAGVITMQGRLIKKPEIANQLAVDALRPHDAEIKAERERLRTAEPELDQAVLSDCLAALVGAHKG